MKKLAILGGKPLRERMPEIKPFISKDAKQNIVRAINSGTLSDFEGTGLVKEFEEKFAAFNGVKYAVAVNSGTAALHTALYTCGIKSGDEIILPAFTFVSTASAIMQLNAKPVFADIDINSLNISPDEIGKKISKKTKAIVPVHLYGNPCETHSIKRIAVKNRFWLVEDCAQAHGAKIGKRFVGSFGDFGCFSFAKSKNMTTGEGGMLTTNKGNLAETAKLIRQNGKQTWRIHKMLGFNYRMTEMQAAIGLSQLKHLKKMNKLRQKNAQIYFRELKDLDLKLPQKRKNTEHVFYKFPILLPERMSSKRDWFVKAVKAENVPVESGYATPLYAIEFIKKYLGKSVPKLPNTESVTSRIINLQTAPCLSKTAIVDTCEAIKKVYNTIL